MPVFTFLSPALFFVVAKDSTVNYVCFLYDSICRAVIEMYQLVEDTAIKGC